MANAYRVIKDRLIVKLQAVSALQEVKTEKTFDFNGFPSAFIVPTEGSSDYETNTEDQRIYAFECHIFYQYDQQKTAVADALDNLYDVCDDVLDSFAEDKQLLTPSAMSLPSGKTMIEVRPVFAGYEEIPEKELLKAIIKLSVYISVDNS